MFHHGGYLKSLALGIPAGFGTTFATVDFKGTITLGSILLGILVLVIAGLVTIRSQVVSVWRQEAEGGRERIKTLELEAKEQDKQHALEIAGLERTQQEVRHQLKDELAACKAELTVEKAKHDLSSIVEQMNKLHHEAMSALHEAQGAAVASVAAALLELGNKVEIGQTELRQGQQQTMGILTDIRDALAPRST